MSWHAARKEYRCWVSGSAELVCETRKPRKGLVPREGSERVTALTKAFGNALIRETATSIHSVVVFLCRAGLKVGEAVTNLARCVHVRMAVK